MVDEAHLVEHEEEPNCSMTVDGVRVDSLDEFPLSDVVDEAHTDDKSSSFWNIDNLKILPYPRRADSLLSLVEVTPRTFEGALPPPEKDFWKAAIDKELCSMESLKVWEVVERQESYKLVGTAWRQGVDFEKTYAPTGRLNSLRMLIALAAAKGLKLHQIDIKSAFLNAPLREEVYLHVPQGLVLDQKKHCLWLKKAIYRLKKATLAWYQHLKEYLLSIDFIAYLMLGVKITHNSDSICLDQQHVAESLLDQYSMCECQPVSTHLVPNEHLSTATEEEITALKNLKVNYLSAIGSINYLSPATHPYLSFALSCLSQYLENPGLKNWKAFIHVLCYLKGSLDVGLRYPQGGSQGITSWSDADWGNCQSTRRSVTGYLATFHGCLVLWKMRKQPPVSISTAEDKYKALCDLTSELLWQKQWSEEAQILKFTTPITVWEDNQGCINMANGDCNFNSKPGEFSQSPGISRVAVRGDVKENDLIPSKRLKSSKQSYLKVH
ncbi:hypothetical protein O181_051460 [Austropuccinia psidii MF-1]|uniref:Reverse transcriptase Ty1/copia-type domain-containing protein n=1 Tax=Austropuccinia psidii MF-1 TaxID=1389203 RepID=A0A9Q3E336_9BASI|nr:hypothetical protein [Austropuccinia psidii MF-1]